MQNAEPDCRETFLHAIQKVMREHPELPSFYYVKAEVGTEISEFLADQTASGDGSVLVFLLGREFAGKVMENIPDPDRFEVCALVRESIELCFSIKDSMGFTGCTNFYTLGHIESLLAGGIQINDGLHEPA